MYLESKMTSTMDQETILPQSLHHNHNGKPHIKPINGGPILSTSSLETVEPANGTRANGSGRELLIVLRGNVKKKSLFKDIIHIGGWVVKAFSKIFY